MKNLIATLILALIAAPVAPQGFSADRAVLAAVYDLDSASYIYCATRGINGTTTDRNKNPPQGAHLIDAAAGSTTVTSDGSRSSFNNVLVGDILFINRAGVTLERVVMTKADANSITVNAALNAAATVDATFTFRTLSCGTTDTSGAFPVQGFHSFTIQVILAQENSASTDYQVECRNFGPGMAWSIVNGPNNDTGVFNDIFATDLGFSECRVGAKVNTDDGADTGAAAEQLTIIVTWRK